MMLTEGREREDPTAYAQDKIHYLYDKGSHSSYFYTQVDVRISLVVIFESKKSEKDSYVNTFMNDCHTFKMYKIFHFTESRIMFEYLKSPN